MKTSFKTLGAFVLILFGALASGSAMAEQSRV